MGICPCSRQSFAEKTSPSATRSSDRLNLRSDEQILELSGFLSAYYRNILLVRKDGPVDILSAQLISSHQDCAIVRIPKSLYHSAKKAKSQMFHRLRQLDHPHLQRIFEICRDRLNYYIVSEAFKGGDLFTYFSANGRATQGQAATVLHQILSALAYCHHKNLAHTYITMQNIGIVDTAALEVRLGGLHHFDDNLNVEKRKWTFFTAPDKIQNAKSDIWACGVLLFALLTGRFPYQSSLFTEEFAAPEIELNAMSLVTAMLSKLPMRRPTAVECLSHPWIANLTGNLSSRLLPSVALSLSQLHSQRQRKPLREAIVKFIVSRVMEGSDLAALAQAFSFADLNRDGMISAQELVRCFRDVTQVRDPQLEAERVLRKMNKELDAPIDYSEFLLAAFEDRRILTSDVLRATFSTLDRDGNGLISISEMRHFFRIDTQPDNITEWQQLIAPFDQSGDCVIDYLEFEVMMTKAFDDKECA